MKSYPFLVFACVLPTLTGCDVAGDIGGCAPDYAEHRLELWSVGIAGNERRIVYDDWAPSFSSDMFFYYSLLDAAPNGGSLFLRVRGQNPGLDILNLSDRSVSHVPADSNDGRLAISSDGTRMAFVPQDATSTIRLVEIDETNSHTIVEDSVFLLQPRWLQNDKYLAYMRLADGHSGGVWILDVASGTSTQVTQEVSATYDITDDQSAVVYRTEIDCDTGCRSAVIIQDGFNVPPKQLSAGDNPQFSPTEDRITYHVEQVQRELWIMDRDGSNQVQLSAPGQHVSNPVFSPDGSKVIYEADWALWTVNADGTDRRQLAGASSHFKPPSGMWDSVTPTVGSPAFSRDGQTIYYLVDNWYWSDGCF